MNYIALRGELPLYFLLLLIKGSPQNKV